MRNEAIKKVYEAALRDERIFFITGDQGHTGDREMAQALGNRYINAGMAEQNIIGVAAGLALSGMKVFVYAITPFITLRCLEQIKVDVCAESLDVTILGTGSGFVYGVCGVTHSSIEEVAALRALPNMKVIVPANPREAGILVEDLILRGGPAYVRLNKAGEPDPVPEAAPVFGKGLVLRSGTDATIIAMGTIAGEALRAAELLAQRGVSVEVVNMHTVKPIDIELLRDRFAEREAVVTVEEHNVIGGLGGAVAEVALETHPRRARFRRLGVKDAWPEIVGSQQYLRGALGLSGEGIADAVIDTLKEA